MVAPAAVLGGLGMGFDLIGGIIGSVKARRQRAREAALLAEEQARAQLGRLDTPESGGAGPTAGLDLRPPEIGNLGFGMGTLQTTMFPGMQKQSLFQPSPINYGLQQPQQPQQNFSVMGDMGNQQSQLTPNASGGGPPQAPSFNLLGSMLNQRRGPYGQ